MDKRECLLVVIGHGATTAYLADGSRVSGGNRQLAEDFTAEANPQCAMVAGDGCVVVDLTAMEWERLTRFSIRGPMVDVRLTEASRLDLSRVFAPMVAAVCENSSEATLAVSAHLAGDRDPFDGYGSLDQVPRDVYVNLARRHGAAVLSVSDWCASHGLVAA
jgi:hypothetical protein